MGKVAIIRDPLCLKHRNGPAHPERPERLVAIDEMIEHAPFRNSLIELPSRNADPEELAMVHTASYIDLVRGTAAQSHTYLDPDTGANRHTWNAALRAAGSALCAIDAIMENLSSAAFALTRPPGHHAETDRAMGFCIFNNVAIAAQYARKRYGLTRIAILDWDVHHGNGTMKSFYDTAEVLYASLHQYPYYPGTGKIEDSGAGSGSGFTVNLPLRAGLTDADYLALFREVIVPVFDEYKPELILVSAGFDAHRDDPLAGMELSDHGFAAMTQAVSEVAARHASGRMAYILEGGYNVRSLAAGVGEVLETLISTPENGGWCKGIPPQSEYIGSILREARAELAPHWRCLEHIGNGREQES